MSSMRYCFILLYPFEEKEESKKKSKDSYGPAIRIALERYMEVIGND